MRYSGEKGKTCRVKAAIMFDKKCCIFFISWLFLRKHCLSLEQIVPLQTKITRKTAVKTIDYMNWLKHKELP